MTLDTILAGLDILTTTKSRLRGNNYALVLLEMAMIRLIRLEDLLPIAQLTQLLSQAGGNSFAIPVKSPTNAPTKSIPSTDPAKKNDLSKPFSATNPINGKANPVTQPIVHQELDASNLEKLWAQAREKVGTILSGHLEKANLPAISGPKSLAIRFPFRYNHSKEYCERPENVRWIEEAPPGSYGGKVGLADGSRTRTPGNRGTCILND